VARSAEALFELAAEVQRERGKDVVEAVVADVTTSEGIAAVCDAVQSCFQVFDWFIRWI
jgi:NADP-dependent 3-hydroxy acid dehydrogenase YdfG